MIKRLFGRSAPHTSLLSAADVAFADDLQAALLSQEPPRARLMLYLVASILSLGLLWASLARVEEVTQGQGKVIAMSREQKVQSLDGGVIKHIHVSDGTVVEQGQLLVNIDPVRAQAGFRETQARHWVLQSTVARLRAEAYGQPLDLREIAMESAETAQQAQAAYDARRQALETSLTALAQSLALANQEVLLTQPLAEKGLVSQVELLRLRRQSSDLNAQIIERRDRYRAEAAAELSRLEAELGPTKELLVGRADVQERTLITAPLRGTVKNLRVHTVGGVVQPGEVLMDIVPMEDRLLIEGRIRPSDVAYLRPGLPATVKLTAYDYNIYGGMTGTLVHLSADTLEDQALAASGRADAEYYRFQVLTDHSRLQVGDRSHEILPGMVVSVGIRTGEKTILDYLLKPVLKAKEAFRER